MEREKEASFSRGGTLRGGYCHGMLEPLYFYFYLILILSIFFDLIFFLYFLDNKETYDMML